MNRLFAVLTAFFFFLFIVNFTGADNLIANGNFSSVVTGNLSTQSFDGGFLGFFPTCTDVNAVRSLPTNWTFNSSFDAQRITSISSTAFSFPASRENNPFLFLYTIAKYNLYTFGGQAFGGHLCGYSTNGTHIFNSGTSAAGNLSFNPSIIQNVTIPNSSYTLSFNYWFSYLPDQAPDGRGYHCTIPNNGSNGGNACKAYDPFQNNNFYTESTSNFRVDLYDASTLANVFSVILDGKARGEGIVNQFALDLSTNPSFAAGNYTLKFTLLDAGLNTSFNQVFLDDVSLSANGASSNIGSNLIVDTNSITGIGVDNWTISSNDASKFTTFNFAKISRNFSDFYKYVFHFSPASPGTAGGSFNGYYNVTGYDSSGNVYVIDVRNDGTLFTCAGGGTQAIFDNNSAFTCDTAGYNELIGYAPSNVTKFTFKMSNVASGFTINELNVTLNAITIKNRNGWKLPIANTPETILEVYPLLFYGFNYASSNSLINYTVYNFRNTSGFGFSLNSSEGSGINNIYMFDSSNNLLATSSDTRTYANEYTRDFTSILADNGGIVGNLILINRTSANSFFNNVKAVPTSKFTVSFSTGCQDNVCVDPATRQFAQNVNGFCQKTFVPDTTCSANFNQPSGQNLNTAFTSVFAFAQTSQWSIGLKLLVWTSLTLAVTFGIVWQGSPRIQQLGDFRNIGILLVIVFMLGTFLPPGETPFVPVWFWGFIMLGVVFFLLKDRVFGEKS